MRLEKQNRRSCLGLLVLLALLVAAIAWASLGGVSDQTAADDPQGPIDAVPPPADKTPPAGTGQPLVPPKPVG